MIEATCLLWLSLPKVVTKQFRSQNAAEEWIVKMALNPHFVIGENASFALVTGGWPSEAYNSWGWIR